MVCHLLRTPATIDSLSNYNLRNSNKINLVNTRKQSITCVLSIFVQSNMQYINGQYISKH